MASDIRPTVLPPPSRVFREGWEFRSLLWENTKPTLQETAIGFSVSIVIATLFAVLIDFSLYDPPRALRPCWLRRRRFRWSCIAPLMILWFGFGLAPKMHSRGADHVLPDHRRLGGRVHLGGARGDGSPALDGSDPPADLPQGTPPRLAPEVLLGLADRHRLQRHRRHLRRVRRRPQRARDLHPAAAECVQNGSRAGSGDRRDRAQHPAVPASPTPSSGWSSRGISRPAGPPHGTRCRDAVAERRSSSAASSSPSRRRTGR